MKSFVSRSLVSVVTAGVLLLAGCGGGGGSSDAGTASTTPTTTAATAVAVKGVAATGSPLPGASIQVVDSTGSVVASTVADASGSYTLEVPLRAKAPFVVSASKDGVMLFSPMSSTSVTTVNVTPVTNLAAAQLSPTGDPAALAGQLQSGTTTFDAASVAAVVKGIVDALQPLLTNVGTSVDPISGTFAANGTGYDLVLNSLSIAINPTGTSSNITISVKTASADGAQVPEVSFVSGTTPPALPASVATAALPPTNTDAMISAYLAKLQDCFALPVTDRVTGSSSLADTVKAPICRETFWNNDPATFKNNGSIVNYQQSFWTLFSDVATGAKFSNGALKYLHADGSMLVSWRAVASNGDVSWSRVLLKPQNGELKAYGNQYNYSFQPRPWSEFRDFLNTPQFTYVDTGVDLNFGNVVSGGSTIFDRVVVTTPDARSFVLKPQPGLSYLTIARADGTLAGTSVIRMAGRFKDSTLAAQPRSLTGEGVVWASNPAGSDTDWTDAEIGSINNLGSWKAEIFLAGNTGSTPDTIQYAVTTSRPLTSAELGQRTWATLVPNVRSELIALSSSTGNVALADGQRIQVGAADGTDGWIVPAGANEPTTAQAQGYTATNGAPRWNDSVNVGPSARKAVISCSTQSAGDPHCSATTPGTYASAARMYLVQLFSADADDIRWITGEALFKVQLP